MPKLCSKFFSIIDHALRQHVNRMFPAPAANYWRSYKNRTKFWYLQDINKVFFNITVINVSNSLPADFTDLSSLHNFCSSVGTDYLG